MAQDAVQVRTQLKLTIAKLIELSIDTNKDAAVKIILGKKPFRLTVDQNGHAVLSSQLGTLSFKGSPALEEIGIDVGLVSVNFSRSDEDDKTINYTGAIKVGIATVSISGSFDVEQLILSCSGLLCIAARALKGRTKLIHNKELEEIMR